VKAQIRSAVVSSVSPTYRVNGNSPTQWVDGSVPTAYGFIQVYHERCNSVNNYTRFRFIWRGREYWTGFNPNVPLTDRQLTIRARRFVKEIVHDGLA